MTTAMYPALMPCRTRPAYRAGYEPSDRLTTGIAARNIAADETIILLRPKKSHSQPAVIDDSSPPSSTAPTMWLIWASEYAPIAFMYGSAAAITPKSTP